MPTSLVTGGAGFIGSHVCSQLIQLSHKVVALDDLSGGYKENVPGKATFVKGSISDVQLLDSLFRAHHFNYVFHFAAYAAEALSHFIKRFNYINNLVGSVNLINAAINYSVECFVFTSSIAVYGAAPSPLTEDMIPLPTDPYGIAKFAVELELSSSHELFGLDYVIFRPHNVYGERQNIADRYRNVVGIFMNQVLKGEPMTVFGDGMQQRAFTHIDDVAPVIASSVDLPAARNQVFNLGADSFYSVNQLATIVAAAMDAECVIDYLEPRHETKIAYCCHSKAKRVFGLDKHIPIDEGVRRMATWVKAHGARQSSRFENIEVPKNMPSSWATLCASSRQE